MLVVLPDHLHALEEAQGLQAAAELLAEVGRRLTAVLRSHDLAVRLDGRGHAILATDVLAVRDLERLADRLSHAVRGPSGPEVDGTDRVTVSVGVAPDFDGVRSLDELLGRAAGAARARRRAGGDGVAVGEVVTAAARTTTRWDAIQEIHRAVAGDDLVLHYQPIRDLHTGRIEAFEALVRWRHPVRGLLHPAAFLPDVAAAGLTARLTARVVADAAVLAASAGSAVARPVPVSINVDRWQAPVEELVTLLATQAALLDHPASLIVELPEYLVLTAGSASARPSNPGGTGVSRAAEPLGPSGTAADVGTLVHQLRLAGVDVAIDGGDGDGSAVADAVDPSLLAWYKLGRSWMEPHLRPALPALIPGLVERLPEVRVVGVGIADEATRVDAVAAGLDWGQGFALGRPVEARAALKLLAPAGSGAGVEAQAGSAPPPETS